MFLFLLLSVALSLLRTDDGWSVLWLADLGEGIGNGIDLAAWRERARVQCGAWSCSGWLAWGVTVFNCSHIWRRVAICQKRALILPSESWKTFTLAQPMPPFRSPCRRSPYLFFNNNHKSCCTNVFHFGCRSVINWKAREKRFSWNFRMFEKKGLCSNSWKCS